MNAILDRIEKRQTEAARLTRTLVYYEWLVENGMSWETVKGVADVTEMRRRQVGHFRSMRMFNCISFKLRDGTIKVVDNVPFDMGIVFNRPV